MIEERSHILGHRRAEIGGRVVELAGRTMAAIVERDRAAPGAGQCRHPARCDPIDLFVRCKAVDEHNWLALPFVEESNLDAVMRELRHAGTIRSRRPEAKAKGGCRRILVMSASDRARLADIPNGRIVMSARHVRGSARLLCRRGTRASFR